MTRLTAYSAAKPCSRIKDSISRSRAGPMTTPAETAMPRLISMDTRSYAGQAHRIPCGHSKRWLPLGRRLEDVFDAGCREDLRQDVHGRRRVRSGHLQEQFGSL